MASAGFKRQWTMEYRFATDSDLDLLAEWNHQLIRDEGHRNPMLKRLRLRTRTGRPAGDAVFVERLEDLNGRFLAPRKGGRPRKDRRT